MKEIPMLFSTPMVQALLDKRKTQTRRLAAMPVGDHHGTDIMDWGLSKHPYQKERKWLYNVQSDVDSYNSFELKPKYGQPGDLLYVRETWFPAAINGNKVMVGYCDKEPCSTIEFTTEKIGFYWRQMDKGRMIPSIHMPKEAARIWLQVADIRVERLQDISEEDAKDEGVIVMPEQAEANATHRHILKDRIPAGDHQLAFCNLWREIHFTSIQDQLSGKDGWNENPWVWVISFKVVSTTGHP